MRNLIISLLLLSGCGFHHVDSTSPKINTSKPIADFGASSSSGESSSQIQVPLSFSEKIEAAKSLLAKYPTGQRVLRELKTIYGDDIVIRSAPKTSEEGAAVANAVAVESINPDAAVKVSDEDNELGMSEDGHYYLLIKAGASVPQMAQAIAHGLEHIKIHRQLDYFEAVNAYDLRFQNYLRENREIVRCLEKKGFGACEKLHQRRAMLEVLALNLLDEYRAFLVNIQLEKEGLEAQELLGAGSLEELFARVYVPMYTGAVLLTEDAKKLIIGPLSKFSNPMELVVHAHADLSLKRVTFGDNGEYHVN